MKMHRRFLLPLSVFLFCTAVLSPLLAQENLSALVKRVEPSAVVILTYDKQGGILGQGSGFFITMKGDVITNRHVLQGATRAEIKTAEGKVYPIMRVVAEDKEGDLIRVSLDIPPEAVHHLPVSTVVPEVGERVIVIGSPLGLQRTVSDGIVSAVRDIPEFGQIIQITAPISTGSSGSPVVNMKGEVIGVATFLVVEGQNLNFAIPAKRVEKLAPITEFSPSKTLLALQKKYPVRKGQTLTEWGAASAEEWLASAEGLYSIGLRFLWAQDYKKALSHFEKAVEEKPRYAEAYFQIGYCKGNLGIWKEAAEAFKQAIRIKPDFAKAHLNLGVAYGNLGRYAEEIKASKQAIRIQPDYADAHFSLGVAYGNLGRWKEAVEAYRQAIRIKPDYADAHSNLSAAYGELGRWKEALKASKQAIRIKPDCPEAHCNLGVAYGNLGRWEEALEASKQAIRIKPDYVDAHSNLGVAYGNLGRYQEEIEAYKQAIRIKPDDAVAHFNLALAYGDLERWKEAVEASKQAIRIKPDYAEAHCNLGVAYLSLGDSGSALKEYKILKDLDRDLANWLFNLIYE